MNVKEYDPADEEELDRLMRVREAGLNRQLAVTLFFTGVAYALCLICSLTGVYLTGAKLGLLGFLPGTILLIAGALVARCFENGDHPHRWVKYFLLSILFVSVMTLSLIQLVWAVPLMVGGAAFVYAYLNVRLTVIANTLILLGLPIAAAMNALWGMPNPDMLPYPETVSGIREGYVTLWAMEHHSSWDTGEYFVRILRFHTLPLLMLMMIITGCGFAMVRRAKQRQRLLLARARRLREIETCLLLMLDGNHSQETLLAILGETSAPSPCARPLSADFVKSIPPEAIPDLMRRFRRQCEKDAVFAEWVERDPESALRSLQQA